MTPAPTFDSGLYNAPRYRITQVRAAPQSQIAADGSRILSWAFGMSLYPRLRPGIAAEFSREDLLGLLGKLPAAQLLGGLFTQESLKVEAWLDNRWVIACLEASSSSGTRKRGTGRAPGRPRINEQEREKLVHLRDHNDPLHADQAPWEIADLVGLFIQSDRTYKDPEGTIQQRLTRWRPDHPRSKCSLCAKGDFPLPPAIKMTKHAM